MPSINKKSYILYYMLILHNKKNWAKKYKNTQLIDFAT